MGYVYILQEIDLDSTPTGLYKIGHTTISTEKRKKQYQAGNSRPLEELHTIEVDDSQSVETELHRRFDNWRLKGYGGGDEWFDFRGVDISQVLSIMDEYNEVDAYQYPQSTYYEPSHSYQPSNYSNNFDLFESPILWILGALFLIVIAFSSKTPKLENSERGVISCRDIFGCTGTIDASKIGYNAANIRSSPGKNSQIITTINNGETVTFFEESNGWIRVSLKNGKSGWIANNLIK